jgi:hypothetical protein
MRITLFTSNQPRHLALINALAGIADEVFAVQECSTVFPGRVDDFFRKSLAMEQYFARVQAAEKEVFGSPRFPARAVHQLPLKMGDLRQLDLACLSPALSADVYIVFGASFIRGPLCEHLVRHRAVNIHMGISPYYRGSATNFWAMYDRRPDLVGATIHLLSQGLDSGPMLFHALPAPAAVDPFVYGMRAVAAAHAALVRHIHDGTLLDLNPVAQDRAKLIRYSKNADFSDEVATEYLSRLPTPQQLASGLQARDRSQFVRPAVL